MSDPRVLGTPGAFVFEGQTLKVAPRSFNHEAAFRVWLEGEHLRGLQRHRHLYSELEYQQQLAGFSAACATGQYSYPMPLCMQGLMSFAGAREMAFICLTELNKGVTRELIERIFADDAKWDELRLIRQGLDDPNRPAPAQDAPAATAGAGATP
jgi:hypothetical protein